MGLHQLKCSCTAKGIINKIKRQPTEWENIFTDTCNRGLISKIYKNLQNSTDTHQKNPLITQLKNGQRTLIDTSPKRTYRWPIDIWKDAQCDYSSERCKLKSQWDIISHLSEWLSSIHQQTTSAGEDVEKEYCWWECRLVQPCGKQYGDTWKI